MSECVVYSAVNVCVCVCAVLLLLTINFFSLFIDSHLIHTSFSDSIQMPDHPDFVHGAMMIGSEEHE